MPWTSSDAASISDPVQDSTLPDSSLHPFISRIDRHTRARVQNLQAPADDYPDAATKYRFGELLHPRDSFNTFLIAAVLADIKKTSPMDSRSLFIAEITDKAKQTQETHQAYRERIEDLRNDAELDGFTVNEVSETDFWSFVTSIPYPRKAGLVLMDNGNLRAVWEDNNGNLVGLQFLGDQWIEYVIFKRRPAAEDVSRVAGHDTLDGIKGQVRTFDLAALVYT